MALRAGALSEGGGLCLNGSVLRLPGVRLSSMWSKVLHTHHDLELLQVIYRGSTPLITLERRIVIQVDDGVSDGLLQLAALATLHRAHARQCIVATPGGPKVALQRISHAADVLVPSEYLPPSGHALRKPDDDEIAALFHSYQQPACSLGETVRSESLC